MSKVKLYEQSEAQIAIMAEINQLAESGHIPNRVLVSSGMYQQIMRCKELEISPSDFPKEKLSYKAFLLVAKIVAESELLESLTIKYMYQYHKSMLPEVIKTIATTKSPISQVVISRNYLDEEQSLSIIKSLSTMGIMSLDISQNDWNNARKSIEVIKEIAELPQLILRWPPFVGQDCSKFKI